MTGHEGHRSSHDQYELNQPGQEKNEKRIEVSDDFKNQLKQVVENYISLKNALVGDDSEKAKKSANAILQSLDQVDMKLLNQEDARVLWMNLEKKIRSASESIASTSEITKQRIEFKTLSSDLTMAVQMFGINQKVFNQFCPMADNNNGAYWLSLEEEIRNPYFGSAMHSCGNVAEVLE